MSTSSVDIRGDVFVINGDKKPFARDSVADYSSTSVDCHPNVEDEPQAQVRVYKQRFWILALFSYVAFLIIVVWGTFGPIMESAEYAFGWRDGYIALLDGWAPIFCILCMVPFNWATQKHGLRVGLLLASSLVTLATGVRCISLNDTAFTYLASLGSILNGMGSCLTLSLPAMLSSTWFPAKERATATAIGALATQMGGAGMYFSPSIVRTPEKNETGHQIYSRDDIKSDIRVVMFIHFGMALFGLICALIYFPKQPPSPPSLSSSVSRVNYFQSLKLLIKNKQVMGIVLSYMFVFSIPICWISVMNFSLNCVGITQNESMWIAITACIISSLLAFTVALATDYFYGYLKVSIIGLLLGSSCFYLWFVLITEKVIIISSSAQVYIAVVCAVSLQYASVPLMIELAVELAYPCPESVVGAIFTFLMDSVSAIFLLLMIVPSECFVWLSYSLLASAFLTIGPIVFVKEVHNRSKMDRPDQNVPPQGQ